MQVRFLTGPAGSGKTFRCIREIHAQLSAAAEGPPIVLVAPKQATYELERRLLGESLIGGYTRLRVLSFERLASFVFEMLHRAPPDLLSEEGRVMVLRAILARKRKDLRLFRASARLNGFAQQLSSAIAELQKSQLTPEMLRELAQRMAKKGSLGLKLQDIAALMQEYTDWLKGHNLEDRERLLETAAQAWEEARAGGGPGDGTQSKKLELYVDGFAEFARTEIELLAVLLPSCARATITFCLEPTTPESQSRLPEGSVARQAMVRCQTRFTAVPGVEIASEHVAREPEKNRFAGSQLLQHLEKHWSNGKPYSAGACTADDPGKMKQQHASVRLIRCLDPEREVTFAAREILAFVRAGGRYRDVAVLVRNLAGYQEVFERIFSRYEIPFFLDRRQRVSHHPAAELTRSALRTVALGWQHDDWFAALKTGLLPAKEEEIDRLENEALARGWHGAFWQQVVRIQEVGGTEQERKRLLRLEAELESLRRRLMPPFQKLSLALSRTRNRPTGAQLAAAIRELWAAVRIADTLHEWASLSAERPGQEPAGALHETVWNELQAWVGNLELAFSEDSLPMREWLPIVEAGLVNLTVGLIPPALDQVLIGTIDRSRNPDIRVGIVVGLNESVFPALPAPEILLTEGDRAELERHHVSLGLSARQRLNRERYYAYIACTRPREQLLLTFASRDFSGSAVNPSPFLGRVRQLFPSLQIETAPAAFEWRDCQHPHELFGALLRWTGDRGGDSGPFAYTRRFPALPQTARIGSLLKRFERFGQALPEERLSPFLVEALYGPVLSTSVSRIEQFAACPFKFFVHSGLRAEERKRFELDAREQGSFQHDVLALFHEQLRSENKRWSDITPAEARERVRTAAISLIAGYREGLLLTSGQTRFMAQAMTESLQDFVEIQVGWMRGQYQFDPVLVELPFGDADAQPAWTIDLDQRRQLKVYGRIDRVDLFRRAGTTEALCVVIDYKSSKKQLDPVLMAHGLQLQLLTYLNVLRHWPQPERVFEVSRLVPAGVFYVNLRGKYNAEKNRAAALSDPDRARKTAYRHTGRFDAEALRLLDSRVEAQRGDQFNYRLLQDGKLHSKCAEPLSTAAFMELLDAAQARLVEIGREVYSGAAEVAPFRKGSTTACDQCEYQGICRIDPWTHHYRVLDKSRRSVESSAMA